jgi:hypothetical protein
MQSNPDGKSFDWIASHFTRRVETKIRVICRRWAQSVDNRDESRG